MNNNKIGEARLPVTSLEEPLGFDTPKSSSSRKMINENKVILTCAASVLGLIVGYVSYVTLKARQYVLRSQVRRLMIYPIKSLPGLEVDRIEFNGSLLKYRDFYDRSWVLMDENSRIITLRTEPSLSRIELSALDDALLLKADNMPSIKIPNTQPLKKGK